MATSPTDDYLEHLWHLGQLLWLSPKLQKLEHIPNLTQHFPISLHGFWKAQDNCGLAVLENSEIYQKAIISDSINSWKQKNKTEIQQKKKLCIGTIFRTFQ